MRRAPPPTATAPARMLRIKYPFPIDLLGYGWTIYQTGKVGNMGATVVTRPRPHGLNSKRRRAGRPPRATQLSSEESCTSTPSTWGANLFTHSSRRAMSATPAPVVLYVTTSTADASGTPVAIGAALTCGKLLHAVRTLSLNATGVLVVK